MSGLCITRTLLRHTQVNCLLSNKDKELYKDYLCLFRALAMYTNGQNDLESHSCRHFLELITKYGYETKRFHGLSVVDIQFLNVHYLHCIHQ